jgi:hypothetical protein
MVEERNWHHGGQKAERDCMAVFTDFLRSSLLFYPGPQLIRWCHPHLGEVFPPYLFLSGNHSQTHPELYKSPRCSSKQSSSQSGWTSTDSMSTIRKLNTRTHLRWSVDDHCVSPWTKGVIGKERGDTEFPCMTWIPMCHCLAKMEQLTTTAWQIRFWF